MNQSTDQPVTTLEKYFHDTCTPVYSALFAIPLFLTYEIMALVLTTFFDSHFRNGADILLRNLFAIIGLDAFPFLIIIVLVTAAVISGYYKKKYRIEFSFSFFTLMLIESMVLAIMLEALTSHTTNLVLHFTQSLPLSASGGGSPSIWEQLMLSCGAGIYEELVFRLFCLGLLLYLFRLAFNDQEKRFLAPATVLALLISSVIFSWFHYVGLYGGHSFELDSFIFRTIGGIYLSIVYLVRGFGVSAWTHAFYDIFAVLAFF